MKDIIKFLKELYSFIAYCTYYIFHPRRILLLRKTNYGRSDGWEIYLSEKKIAEFINIEWPDMFWFSYELAQVDPDYIEKVKYLDFWYKEPIRYKSKSLNEFLNSETIMIIVNEDIKRNRICEISTF